MDRIRQVFRSLSKNELKNFKQFLDLVHTKGANKPLDLIRMLEKEFELPAETAAEKLYGDPKSKAFIMMKSRLYERMLDFLSFLGENESFPRENAFHEYHIRYRKAALQASVLRGRGLKGLSLPLWREAVEHAEICCAPEWELDGLIQIRNSFQPDFEEFEQLSQKLVQELRETEVNLNASGLYGKFLFLLGQREFSDKPYEYLERVLPEMEAAFEETPTPRAAYYLLLMQFQLAQHRQQFIESKAILEELIALLHREPGLLTDSRYHEPKMQLGLVALKMRDFELAESAFQQVANAYPPGDRLRLRALVMILFPLIASKNMAGVDPVFKELQEAEDSGSLSLEPRLMPQVAFLKSCRAYLQRDLVGAWNHVQDAIILWKDNLGSAVGPRLWEVMILVERGFDDIAGQRLESLRKHIAKYNCDDRFKVVFKLLSSAEKRGFDLQHFQTQQKNLGTQFMNLGWDPTRMELIPFEEWLGRMCEKRR